MDLVKIVHPEAGESMVPASAVPQWRASGWELAPTTAASQQRDEVPPRVSTIANAIGYALASRGVQVTADDSIAAAYRVVDQDPAAQPAKETADPVQEQAEPAEPVNDPGEPVEPGGEPTQQEANKPGRRTRRPSPKECE